MKMKQTAIISIAILLVSCMTSVACSIVENKVAVDSKLRCNDKQMNQLAPLY